MKTDVVKATFPLIHFALQTLEVEDASSLQQPTAIKSVSTTLLEKEPAESQAHRSIGAIKVWFARRLHDASRVDERWRSEYETCEGGNSLSSALHYVMISWIDELFIDAGKWSGDDRLEKRFTQYDPITNSRAAEIPKLALTAGKRCYMETLEVCWLISHLGFEFPANQYEEWFKDTRQLLNDYWNESITEPLSDGMPPSPPEELVDQHDESPFSWLMLGYLAVGLAVDFIGLFFFVST